MTQALFTVPTTGTYEDSVDGGKYRYTAGQVIPLDWAVRLGMPGAELPPDESAFVTSIRDPQEGDLLFYAGGVWINAQPAPTGAAVEIASLTTEAADGYALAFDHTIQPATNRRLVAFGANFGEGNTGTYASIDGEMILENEFGTMNSDAPNVGIAFYALVAPPVGRHEIEAEFLPASTDAAMIALNLVNVVQGASYENLIYATGNASSGTSVSGNAGDMNQYGGGTVSAVSTGDLMLLGAVVTPAQSLSAGTGFELVESTSIGDGDANLYVWRKTADDGADTTFGFGKAESARVAWIVVALAPAA